MARVRVKELELPAKIDNFKKGNLFDSENKINLSETKSAEDLELMESLGEDLDQLYKDNEINFLEEGNFFVDTATSSYSFDPSNVQSLPSNIISAMKFSNSAVQFLNTLISTVGANVTKAKIDSLLNFLETETASTCSLTVDQKIAIVQQPVYNPLLMKLNSPGPSFVPPPTPPPPTPLENLQKIPGVFENGVEDTQKFLEKNNVTLEKIKNGYIDETECPFEGFSINVDVSNVQNLINGFSDFVNDIMGEISKFGDMGSGKKTEPCKTVSKNTEYCWVDVDCISNLISNYIDEFVDSQFLIVEDLLQQADDFYSNTSDMLENAQNQLGSSSTNGGTGVVAGGGLSVNNLASLVPSINAEVVQNDIKMKAAKKAEKNLTAQKVMDQARRNTRQTRVTALKTMTKDFIHAHNDVMLPFIFKRDKLLEDREMTIECIRDVPNAQDGILKNINSKLSDISTFLKPEDLDKVVASKEKIMSGYSNLKKQMEDAKNNSESDYSLPTQDSLLEEAQNILTSVLNGCTKL